MLVVNQVQYLKSSINNSLSDFSFICKWTIFRWIYSRKCISTIQSYSSSIAMGWSETWTSHFIDIHESTSVLWSISQRCRCSGGRIVKLYLHVWTDGTHRFPRIVFRTVYWWIKWKRVRYNSNLKYRIIGEILVVLFILKLQWFDII